MSLVPGGCKLSGLAMPLGAMDADAFRPWIEPAIAIFGTDRCMFASNFPVDGLVATFETIYSGFLTITAHLSSEDRRRLFCDNARRIYCIP